MGYNAYVSFEVKVSTEQLESIKSELEVDLFKDNCDDFEIYADSNRIHGTMELHSKDSEEVRIEFQFYATKYNITFEVGYQSDYDCEIVFYVGKDKKAFEFKDHWRNLIIAITTFLEDEALALKTYEEIEADPTVHGVSPAMLETLNEFWKE